MVPNVADGDEAKAGQFKKRNATGQADTLDLPCFRGSG
jgi:hypothetical protein